MQNIFLKLLSLVGIALVMSVNVEASSKWASCYNASQNRIYFQTQKDLKAHKGKCLGRTYYQGEKGFELIEDDLDANGFPLGTEGASLNITLENGRNLLVTHWTNLTQNNTLIVLEPNFINNHVRVLCRFANYSNKVKAKVDRKDGLLKVLLRYPYPEISENFVTRWVECR